MIPKRYIGDGVYAEVENSMIKLTTQRDEGRWDVIYLEPEVMQQLQNFNEDAMAAVKEIES